MSAPDVVYFATHNLKNDSTKVHLKRTSPSTEVESMVQTGTIRPESELMLFSQWWLYLDQKESSLSSGLIGERRSQTDRGWGKGEADSTIRDAVLPVVAENPEYYLLS